MTEERLLRESRRASWRQARLRLKLGDIEDADFGCGGLGRYVPDIRFRILVLPADPERYMVDFTSDFRAWWLRPHQNPFDNRMTDFGQDYRLTADAAVRYSDRAAGDNWGCHEYVALHRSGAIEFGSGRHAVYELGKDHVVFRLIYMVGRLWSTLALYRKVIERFAVEGPWQLSVALRNAGGSRLGHVGTGWEELTDAWSWAGFAPCLDCHVMASREVPEWPDSPW